ncbi:MAG: hypothetical protein IJH79_19980 [Lentisphaeria bacterium]|nr:hypothetical protein [Lentisphaeria bacterium]
MDINKLAEMVKDFTEKNYYNRYEKKYYKFVYKGDGRCKICSRYNGRVFSEEDLPRTHPNCKCARETTDPADIALGKFQPRAEYFVGKVNFNANRRALEKIYGVQIDGNLHSAPQCKLADMIKKSNYVTALYRHICLREKKVERPYLDGNDIPTIGIGANMTEESVIKKLKNMGLITRETEDILRGYDHNDRNQRLAMEQYLKRLNLKLEDSQILQLFGASLQNAENDVKKRLRPGKWISKQDPDGNTFMEWKDEPRKISDAEWKSMNPLVKAICVDLAFNLGGPRFSNYESFIKAVNARDYRRAALELLNSDDYRNNIKPVDKAEKKKRNLGLAYRRRDAAIELTNLAEEMAVQKKTEAEMKKEPEKKCPESEYAFQ